MFPNYIYFFLKVIQVTAFFSVFSEIFSAIISYKTISPYKEELVNLYEDNPQQFYLYENTKFLQESNYDIIIQIKNIIKQYNDAKIYIYASDTYYYNIGNIIKFN